jgi:hypothetical protein
MRRTQKSLGEHAGSTDVESAHLDEQGYYELARLLKDKYAFDTVAITLRESHSATRNGWSAMMLDDKAVRRTVSLDAIRHSHRRSRRRWRFVR